MKQIDRIMIKAKKLSGNQGELCVALVVPSEKGWSAIGHIWNGKEPSAPRIETSLHDTMDEAVQAIYKLAEQYPNSQDITLIIDDV